jgi:hypothetical protein
MKAVLPNLVEQSKQIEKTFAFVDGIGVIHSPIQHANISSNTFH